MGSVLVQLAQHVLLPRQGCDVLHLNMSGKAQRQSSLMWKWGIKTPYLHKHWKFHQTFSDVSPWPCGHFFAWHCCLYREYCFWLFPLLDFHSNVLLKNLLHIQIPEYSLTSEYNPHISHVMSCPARHKPGQNLALLDCMDVLTWSPVTIHLYYILNRVRQSKTKQADSGDKDSVQGINLLQLLTIFNLI